MALFRWLSRYVKKIEVFGVGIELREIPAEEAVKLLNAETIPEAKAPENGPSGAAASVPLPSPTVLKEDYICVTGTSASTQRAPREIDLIGNGDEIQFHIHKPGGSQPRIRVARAALEAEFASWTPGSSDPIHIAARTARKDAELVFVLDESDEIEVQAGWWIWVRKNDLKAALAELGVRAPW